MLRITRTALVTTFSLAASLSGCADNESTLFIQGVLALESSGCVGRPDADAEFLSQGVMDLEFVSNYIAVVQVGNQLTQQGNREKLRTETSRIQLEGAIGTVFDVNGTEYEFESIATGFVHPAAGTDPGLSAMAVNLVSTDISSQFPAAMATDGSMAVRFRVYGTTLGGQDIESGEYTFPMAVCRGCLVQYPAEAADPSSETYLCGASEVTEEVEVCRLGQDQPFPCTVCASVTPACRDPEANPWYQ